MFTVVLRSAAGTMPTPRPDPSEPTLPPDDDAAIAAARVQARRRLIGAVVLLGAGVLVFPLLFDGKPRPMPGDVKVELRRGEGVVALAPPLAAPRPVIVPPPAESASAAGPASTAPAPQPERRPADPAPTSAPASAPTPAAPPAPPASAKPKAAAEPPRAASAPDAPAPAGSAAAAARFVVQVGAFTDPVALREARQKVEKLGLKTYTQVIESKDGPRTRVRVGPFESKADAEAAGAKIKAAGLPAYMLTL